GGSEQYLSADLIFEKLKERLNLKPHLPEPRRKSLYDGAALILARNRRGLSAVEAQLSNIYRLTVERITSVETEGKALRSELKDLSAKVDTLIQSASVPSERQSTSAAEERQSTSTAEGKEEGEPAFFSLFKELASPRGPSIIPWPRWTG